MLVRHFFSRAGAMLMRAHNGGIDHHVFVVVITRQRLENTLKNPAFRPSAEALRVRFKTWSRVTKLSQHEADGGKFQEREGVAVEIFPVLGETATTIEPCDGSFNDPALG